MHSYQRIGVLAFTDDEDIDSFVRGLVGPSEKVQTCHAKPQNIPSFGKYIDFNLMVKVVILFHSALEGRICITDVEDARYTDVLAWLNNEYGKL